MLSEKKYPGVRFRTLSAPEIEEVCSVRKEGENLLVAVK